MNLLEGRDLVSTVPGTTKVDALSLNRVFMERETFD